MQRCVILQKRKSCPIAWNGTRARYFRALFSKNGRVGIDGCFVPEALGGAGMGYFEYKIAIEEIAKVCGSIGLSMAAHNSLCTNHILMFGSEVQCKKYLPDLASGQAIGAWGLTEANTGSDAMRMRCTATRDKARGGWVLHGTKNWITHGISGDVAVVLARTGELLDSRGITAFIANSRSGKVFQGAKRRTSWVCVRRKRQK